MELLCFFERYYLPLKLRGRSRNTERLYRHTVRSFSAFLNRPATLSDLDNDTVGMYLCYLNRRELSPYTVNKERSQLLAIWNFAARRKQVDRWPDVQPEIAPLRAPVAWLEPEMQRIVEQCLRVHGFVGRVPARDFWLALHLVLWDTAERIGAVLESRWSWLSGQWLSVPAAYRKGKRADAVYELSDETIEALERIRPLSGEKIFTWPHTKTYLWQRYGRILEKAGLPNNSRSKFHRIRRTVASYYAKAGGNATSLLGHQNPRTTQAYLDPRIVEVDQPHKLIFRLRRKPR